MVLEPFWCENGYRFYFDLESGMVFERPTGLYGRIYRFSLRSRRLEVVGERENGQFRKSKKKKKYANSKWISVKKSFLLLLF